MTTMIEWLISDPDLRFSESEQIIALGRALEHYREEAGRSRGEAAITQFLKKIESREWQVFTEP